MASVHLRPATPADLDAWRASAPRERADNGAPVWFAPRPPDDPGKPFDEADRASLTASLQHGLASPGWLRLWLLLEGDTVRGSVQLKGGRLEAELHRCELAIGIERAFRGQGNGRALLGEALGWARRQPSLAHVDLGVFEGNAAAIALYRRAGFVEVGRRVDAFRVGGASITDVQMTLALR